MHPRCNRFPRLRQARSVDSGKTCRWDTAREGRNPRQPGRTAWPSRSLRTLPRRCIGRRCDNDRGREQERQSRTPGNPGGLPRKPPAPAMPPASPAPAEPPADAPPVLPPAPASSTSRLPAAPPLPPASFVGVPALPAASDPAEGPPAESAPLPPSLGLPPLPPVSLPPDGLSGAPPAE